jgi:hypothetical protein
MPAWMSWLSAGCPGGLNPSIPTHSETCALQLAAVVIKGTVKVALALVKGPPVTA